MPLSAKLERKLQAFDDSSDGEDYYDVTDRSSSESFIDGGDGGDVLSSGDEEGDLDDQEMSDEEENDDEQAQAQVSKISFGTLSKAQDALAKDQSANRKRKRGDESSKSQEDKLEALRERLRQIKAAKLANGDQSSKKTKTTQKKQFVEQESEDDGANDSDSDAAPRARSSKHAPAVQSSKKMVSRKRQVVDVKKPVFRDPRFDSGGRPDENTMNNRYSFLNDYRASEISDLRATIKKTKNEGEKERLKKKLTSMESQEQARKRKEELQNVARDHKKKEKELIKEGKTPFYLKKSEQKKIALVDRFQNMKSKQRDKVIERRRKKVTAKERRNMPDARRTAE